MMPNEIAPSYLFLASNDSQFISGQVLHPNGSKIINGLRTIKLFTATSD